MFISHSSADEAVAADVVAFLERRAVSCWVAPRDMTPAPAYAETLYYALEAAPVFVVLMSASANRSEHVAKELAIADQMKKKIIPVMLEQFEATGAFCYYTRAMHFYSWARDRDKVVERIAEQVAQARAAVTKRVT